MCFNILHMWCSKPQKNP